MAANPPNANAMNLGLAGGMLLNPATAVERAHRSVFVGNIPYDATEEKLKEIFNQAGPVVSFRLVYDRETGKPKGYGFCEYLDTETSQCAMRNLNNHDFNGRPLRVGIAAGENKDDKSMQQALGGPIMESPYGDDVEPAKAPEAISKAVASLPPEQMFELMKQMKMCIQNNPNEARNMLLQNPQLAYALLQAQIVMKIVDPQVALAMLHRQTEQIPPLLPTDKEKAVDPPAPAPTVEPPLQQQISAPPPQLQQQQPAAMGLIPGLQVGPSHNMGGPPAGMAPPHGQMQGNMAPGPDFGRGPDRGMDMQMGGMMGGHPQQGMMNPRMDGQQPQHFMGDQRDAPRHDMMGRGPPGPDMGRGPPDMGRGPPGPDMGRGPPGPDMGRGPPGPDMGRGPPDMGGPHGMRPMGVEPTQQMGGGGGDVHGPGRGGGGGPPGPQSRPTGMMSSQNPPPSAPAPATPISAKDQEKAALIMQVLQLSDEQIALLPPDQRQSILILKDQISRSGGVS